MCYKEHSVRRPSTLPPWFVTGFVEGHGIFTFSRSGSQRMVVFANRLIESERPLLDRWLPRGEHAERWDGLDDIGRRVPAGVYFTRLSADGRSLTRRMVLGR